MPRAAIVPHENTDMSSAGSAMTKKDAPYLPLLILWEKDRASFVSKWSLTAGPDSQLRTCHFMPIEAAREKGWGQSIGSRWRRETISQWSPCHQAHYLCQSVDQLSHPRGRSGRLRRRLQVENDWRMTRGTKWKRRRWVSECRALLAGISVWNIRRHVAISPAYTNSNLPNFVTRVILA